jgi:hypothetical protein
MIAALAVLSHGDADMALNLDMLSKAANPIAVTGRARNQSHWHYDSGADNAATVVAAGYFNGAREYLQVGDLILAEVGNNAALRYLRVTAVPATGDVTVANISTWA